MEAKTPDVCSKYQSVGPRNMKSAVTVDVKLFGKSIFIYDLKLIVYFVLQLTADQATIVALFYPRIKPAKRLQMRHLKQLSN